MKTKLAEERGNVLVTAILLMSIMLSVGIAVASTVDTQTSQSRKERERESTFNLAEAALSAQTFILGRRGTGTATSPYPVDGLPRNAAHRTSSARRRDTLMRSYTGDASQVDFGAGSDAAWKTDVLDDADASGNAGHVLEGRASSAIANWPRYDANDNRHVWVRSEAVVRGHKRAIVAWVKIEDRIVSFPQLRGALGLPARQEHRRSRRAAARELDGLARHRRALQPAAAVEPASTSTPRRARSSSRRGTTSSSTRARAPSARTSSRRWRTWRRPTAPGTRAARPTRTATSSM